MIWSRHALAALLVAAAAFAIYARRLDVPPALPDETALIQQARAIAETGRDGDGQFLPLYVRLHDNVWTPPLPVYATVLFLTAIGLSEPTLRLPSVVMAAVDVALVYGVARQLFGRTGLALTAAALLILTPSHFMFGRVALASVYPIAFVLGWLWCVIAFVQRRSPVALFTGSLCLGVGFYSHSSAVLTMPIYFVLTMLTLWAVRSSMLEYVVASAGAAVPLLILVPWFYSHHDVFRYTLGDWGFHTLANPRDGFRYSLFNWPAIASRSSLYWGFFSPSYLFFTGGGDVVSSAGRTGVLLGLTAIPWLCGIVEIVRARWSDPVWRVILLGCLAAPLAASTFTEPKAAGRALAMLPFAILIVTAGVDVLLKGKSRVVRFACVAALVLLPIQFYRFYGAYLTQG